MAELATCPFRAPAPFDNTGLMRLISVLLIAVATVGCSGGSEEDAHGGKTLSEWVSQAREQDPAARLAAYEALGKLRGSDAAANALQEFADSDTTRVPERIVAARNLYRITGDPGRAVLSARAAIRAEADSANGVRSIKEIEDLIFWVGIGAKPLADDLRYAMGKIRGRDAPSIRRRQRVQQVVDGIPKA